MVSAEQLGREEVVAFLGGQPGTPEDVEALTGGAWSSAWAYRAGGEELVVRFGREVSWYETDRLRGYKQALAAAGIRVEPALIRRGPHDAATAAEHAARLLKSPGPPSAIFAASDTQAIGVLAAADRLGVAIPERLSVVGFDDIESAAFMGLSTVRQPLALSGAEGARRLCALLRGEKVRPLRQELPIELMARGSSAAARS